MTAPNPKEVASVPEQRFTRRASMWLWVPAERMIYDAVQEVERMGADVALTDAVILLGKARDRVADFVDRAKVTEIVGPLRTRDDYDFALAEIEELVDIDPPADSFFGRELTRLVGLVQEFESGSSGRPSASEVDRAVQTILSHPSTPPTDSPS
jgi:hypothetical protein